jgi:hypothetical protein
VSVFPTLPRPAIKLHNDKFCQSRIISVTGPEPHRDAAPAPNLMFKLGDPFLSRYPLLVSCNVLYYYIVYEKKNFCRLLWLSIKNNNIYQKCHKLYQFPIFPMNFYNILNHKKSEEKIVAAIMLNCVCLIKAGLSYSRSQNRIKNFNRSLTTLLNTVIMLS